MYSMEKLIIVYNFAQRYREPIFSSIDTEWDCEWYFGRNTTDIKGMDISVLKNVTEVDNKTFIKSPWYFQKKIIGLFKRRDVSAFLILGEPYCVSTWLLCILIKLFNSKKKIYFWSHGWYGKESKSRRIIKKAFFKLADGIFLYGNYAKRLMTVEGFDERKLYVIHNSLHHDRQLALREQIRQSSIFRDRFKNDNPNIIFIGRLTEVKRLDLLIKAVALLRNRGKYFNVTFIGDGTMRDDLQQLVSDEGLDDCVWFYGACYDETANAELIYNADLCVAPGNVGLTAMHSMVFGCPVLTHDDFPLQMPEFEAVRENETGCFFKRNDIESLADAISGWFRNNGSRREAVRQNCFNEIDNEWTPGYQMKVLKSVFD